MRSPIYQFTTDGRYCDILNSDSEVRRFKVMKPIETLPIVVHYKDLFEVYNAPSWDKCYYFDYWRNFFNALPQACFFGVRGHNSWQYSLHGTINVKGAIYYYVITAKNNYLYPVQA